MSDETNQGDTIDPTALSLDELRSLRGEMQQRDDVVSYARRVAQARLDLVRTEMNRRDSGGVVSDEVADVLSQHLTGGPGRPPRPAEDLSDDALSVELDAICSEHHYGRVEDLDEFELGELADAIEAFEQRVSQDRRARFDRLDALSAELVRRYRDGEANVDSLLDD
ncbi:MAG: hypothetical protein WA964_10840 [Ilumatobacter sp.]|uniref:RsiG family protein n=1 Tax=Ilumatobacter sp. TaxID=1967498 RepID=UPI003C745280